jgi:hypothetical protein
MEQCALRNLNNHLNTNIYSFLETSGGKSSNPYLNVVHFSTPVLIRHLRQLKTVVFLHICLICTGLLGLPIFYWTNRSLCYKSITNFRNKLECLFLASLTKLITKALAIQLWPRTSLCLCLCVCVSVCLCVCVCVCVCQSHVFEEVNRTEPSPSVSVP